MLENQLAHYQTICYGQCNQHFYMFGLLVADQPTVSVQIDHDTKNSCICNLVRLFWND